MLENLDPFQQVLLGVSSIGILMIVLVIFLTALSLPFMLREPIDLPPIVSVEFIEIKDKTYIPYAPKAREIIEKVKEEKKRVVSEQAPPSAKASDSH